MRPGTCGRTQKVKKLCSEGVVSYGLFVTHTGFVFVVVVFVFLLCFMFVCFLCWFFVLLCVFVLLCLFFDFCCCFVFVFCVRSRVPVLTAVRKQNREILTVCILCVV